MTGLDQSRFQEEINLAAHGFINRAHELTGTGEDDLYGRETGLDGLGLSLAGEKDTISRPMR